MTAMWIQPEWKAPPNTTIVFAHGAIVNGWEMIPLRRRLAQLGYRVRQFGYHSMMRGLEENVALFGKFIAETKGETMHIIGHSMGGVLTRHLFTNHPDPRPGRLIALGSPLVDCWVGRRFGRLNERLGPYVMGRTVHDHISVPRDPVWRGRREFAVIAGTYPLGIGAIFHDLPPPSDGVVLWDETRLEGLASHVTYRLNHFGLLYSRRCCAQMACFLATGKFREDRSASLNGLPTAHPSVISAQATGPS